LNGEFYIWDERVKKVRRSRPKRSNLEEFIPRGRATIALKLLKPKPSDSVLDVGCSQGYVERYLLIGKVKRVMGIDIDRQAIKYAQKKDGSEYYICCNSKKLPFSDQEFDKVLCLDTLEHVDKEDEEKTISEIRRVLRPNGLLVLSVPNDFLNFLDIINLKQNIRLKLPWLYNIYRRLRGRSQQTPPKIKFHRHYSIKKLKEILIGFSIDKAHTTCLFSWFVFPLILLLPNERLKFYARKITGRVEDLDYRFNYGFGFLLIVLAHKRILTERER